MGRKFLIIILAGVSCFGLAGAARAAGFYIQEQSTAALGTAFAGAAALPRDASTIYYNPAGMTALGQGQLSASMDLLTVQSDLEDRGSTLFGPPITGVDSDNPTPFTYLPNFYAAYPVYDDIVWAGLGVSVPFGLSALYKHNWSGRYDSVVSKLMTMDLQPSLAVKISDRLSAGAGVNVQYADAYLSNIVTNGVTEGFATLRGTDWSLGYTAGLTYGVTDALTLGLNYRSRIYHTLDGRIIVENVAGLNENSAGVADLDLPEIASLGLSYRLDDQWTLLGQVNRIGWDTVRDITAIRDDGTRASSTLLDYTDTMSYAFGAEYAWDDDMTLRFGGQYDQTPTNDTYRTTSIPDGDRYQAAIGVGYDINGAFSLNAGALFVFMVGEDINVTRNGGFAGVSIERMDSTFQFFSFGLNYKF